MLIKWRRDQFKKIKHFNNNNNNNNNNFGNLIQEHVFIIIIIIKNTMMVMIIIIIIINVSNFYISYNNYIIITQKHLVFPDHVRCKIVYNNVIMLYEK